MHKIRVFISSVQNELRYEREMAKYALSKAPALDRFFSPVLYEYEPASSSSAVEECVARVESCRVFVLIIGDQAGFMVDDISITHAEFKRAIELFNEDAMKLLVFVKDGAKMEPGAEALFNDVRATGVKYKKIRSTTDLADELEASLLQALHDDFGQPKAAAKRTGPSAKDIIEKASDYENLPTPAGIDMIDGAIAKQMITVWDGVSDETLKDPHALRRRLTDRNHLILDEGEASLSVAGAIVISEDPTKISGLANCYITAEAYPGKTVTGRVQDQAMIAGPAPTMVDGAVDFVMKNTRHPTRVVGERRIELDEYPPEVLREAIVNAIAHRDYEETGGRISLRVFRDRVTVTSPGLPPKPLTIGKLKSGDAVAISRNPLIAQSLYHLKLMEHRGSGFRRIQEYVGASGLTGFDLKKESGFLELTLFGPGEKIDNIPLPASAVEALLQNSELAALSERQQRMAEALARGESLTSASCRKTYGVSRDTAARDFKALIEAGLALKLGAGASTRYIHPEFEGG